MQYTGFDWDAGNARKNEKHGVSGAEIEQVFLNVPLLVAPEKQSMSKPHKPIPDFASEAEERAFWESAKNDSIEYVDWSKARLVSFPKLRPSTETISLRMPEHLLNTIRSHARKLDVPYQSLIKLWCAEKAEELIRRPQAATRLAKRSR